MNHYNKETIQVQNRACSDVTRTIAMQGGILIVVSMDNEQCHAYKIDPSPLKYTEFVVMMTSNYY